MVVRRSVTVSFFTRCRRAVFLSACVAALSACATAPTGNPSVTGATSNPAIDTRQLDPVAAAAFWGTRYDREPRNPEIAVSYSAALRKIGSVDEALRVMTKVSSEHPQHAGVAFEYGKALIEGNRAFEAVRHIEFARNQRSADWKVLSAYGVALDQIGEHDKARAQYDLALAQAPGSVSVLNNKGLSYALSGNLSLAEATLVRASGNRNSSAKVRQNLALVMALKGDLGRAEQLARSDLPPQLAQNNVEYFRSLLTQPAYWQDLATSDLDVPSFDTPAETTSVPTVLDTSRPETVIEPTPLPPVDAVPAVRKEPTLKPQPEILTPVDEKDPDTDDGVPLVFDPAVVPSTANFEADDASEIFVGETTSEEDDRSDPATSAADDSRHDEPQEEAVPDDE